jgi:hypothetical protein
MSEFQQLKWFIVQHLQLDKDGIHIYIGVACYLLAVTIGRLPASSLRALLPGLAVSLLLEVLDLFDTVRFGDPADWGAGLWDLLNTHLIPVVLCLLARRGWLDRDARGEGNWGGRDERI